MKSTDLAIIADILEELKIRWLRWPGGIGYWNLANVRSFLSFRLGQAQIKKFDNQQLINYITQTKLEVKP